MDEVVPGAFAIGEAVDRVSKLRHVWPECVFRQRSAGIDRYLDDTDAVCPGDDLRVGEVAAHREDVGLVPVSDEAPAHGIDVNVLPARIDSAQEGDRKSVV